MDKKPILCLDFDGVIHSYTSGWKGADVIPDPPVQGFFDWAIEAAKYFELHVYSSRSKQQGGCDAMQEWLSTWWIAIAGGATAWTPADRVLTCCYPPSAPRHNDDTAAFSLVISHEKPPAFLTIDDRAWCFDGTWPDPQRLREFKTWQQKEPQAGNDCLCGWFEHENGNVGVVMTRDDWERLIMVLGYAGGAAMKDNDRVTFYKQIALLNRLNVGNPNFTPYLVPEEEPHASRNL